LAILREISAKHQGKIKELRQSDASKLNQFQKGDSVWKSVRTNTIHWKKEKLALLWGRSEFRLHSGVGDVRGKKCIEEYAVNGHGAQRIGFFGSDHSPIMLKFKPEWLYLIQNAIDKAAISLGGASTLKAHKTSTK
jgi:hypothetical protein